MPERNAKLYKRSRRLVSNSSLAPEEVPKKKWTGLKIAGVITALSLIGGVTGLYKFAMETKHDFSRSSDIVMGSDGPLRFSLQPPNFITYDVNFGMTNFSDRADRVIRVSTWIDVLGDFDGEMDVKDPPTFDMTYDKITKIGTGLTGTPIPIAPHESTAVKLVGSLISPSVSTSDVDVVDPKSPFIKPGMYRLGVQIYTTSGEIQSSFCFYLKDSSADELKKKHLIAYTESDIRCKPPPQCEGLLCYLTFLK